MKLLALVPARGGSKRIPNKNIRALGDKPLIAWTLDTIRGVSDVADVLVSTDSSAIAEVALAQGALVPWLRPAELATDTATSMAVCMHALDWYESERGPIDGLLLLQPTTPFRTQENIQKGIDLFRENPRHCVVSFSHAESHPMWCYRLEGDKILPFIENTSTQAIRSQDLPPAYVVNGALYLASPTYLRENNSFLGHRTIPLVMEDPRETLDIDTEWDWLLAETLLKQILL